MKVLIIASEITDLFSFSLAYIAILRSHWRILQYFTLIGVYCSTFFF